MATQANPVGWFEIAGTDIDKTEAFYGDLFNWSFEDGPEGPSYRMVAAGDGIAGGVTTTQAGMPRNYALFSVIVPDVAATCTQVTELGGKVLVGPETMGDIGLVFANLEDIDGNVFGVFSPPTA